MDQRTRAYAAGAAIAVIFLLVQLGALALVEPFDNAGLQAVEDPQNPSNSLVYVGAILVATGFMLLAIKFDVQWVLRAVIIASGSFLALYVFRTVLPPIVTPTIAGSQVHGLAVATAALFALALFVHPEWYVIDATGVVMGASAAGLFGISFGLLPAIVLLTVLAVYDAISVYGTEHMLTLASGVMELKVPVVLVVPLSLSYSFLDASLPDPTEDDDSAEDRESDATGEALGNDGDDDIDESGADDDPLDRDALFIGLGDAVIPTVLVASAAFFAPVGVPEIAGVALPAVTASIGTFVGLALLIRMVLKGRAHAGLPLLNGGTIAGYLVGALASGLTLVQALGLTPYL
ncbi:presenilin family intramembrane aspartyl protease PSH [Haloarculaceae archaeon H-GB2-1]|nr:presenilin family intramembrane aspartyl protease [Haloarculaceae archaeon H-GB1-1]MEA5387296.1 presenilin family intramembrane aspartyl protease PSH [Haloarculaceae archaeon H-GB11]MEA5408762.1 presenilin family intramembrane aspartyl protease PSH [Haloarculaceae archaeon H-GB2-1]